MFDYLAKVHIVTEAYFVSLAARVRRKKFIPVSTPHHNRYKLLERPLYSPD